MCRVAVISAHGCPLAPLGGRETGGMNVYVRELSRAMARQGMELDVYTRLTDPSLPEVTQFDEHARVIHIQAGEVGPMDKNKVLNHMPEFVCRVRQYAREHGIQYDFVHSHYWLSAWAGGLLASRWDIPHIVTFHTLARLKNRVDIGPSETDERAEIEARCLRDGGRDHRVKRARAHGDGRALRRSRGGYPRHPARHRPRPVPADRS